MASKSIAGGRAHRNGVSFYSKGFAVTAYREQTDISIRAKKRKTGGRQLLSGHDLPFLRGIVRLVEILWFAGGTGKLLLFFLIAWLSADLWNPEKGMKVILSAHAWVILVFGLLWIRFSPLGKYHGAEHKVYNALLQGESLSLEKVRQSSRISVNCGTNLAVIYMLLHIPLAAAFPAAFAVIIGFSVSWEIFRLKKSPWTFWFFAIGGWLQKYVVTAEPADDQLEVAIASMAELLRLEEKESQVITD